MLMIANSEKELELKKHVSTIHCANQFSLIQRKLFNALLFNAYPDLIHKSQYEIAVKHLCQIIGYNSHDYAKLKKSLLSLMSVAIEWNLIDNIDNNGKVKWRASSALAAAKLENGICTYEYSSVMRELLYRPEIYGRLNMGVMAKFKSLYGLALYENCIRFQGLAQTPWFSMEIFRKLMGVADNSYVTFKDFKKRVLHIAMAEVNIHGPITIMHELKKEQNKVVAIRFKLLPKVEKPLKNEKSSSFEVANFSSAKLESILEKEFGFSCQGIESLLKKYSREYINEKVEFIINSEPFKEGKIRGLAGYLIEALRKNYQESASSKKYVREKERLQSIQQTADQQQQQREEDVLNKQYYDYVSMMLTDAINNLNAIGKKQLYDDFYAQIEEEGGIMKKWFNRDKLQHPAVKAFFNQFARQHPLLQQLPLITWEEFKKKGGRLQDEI